MLNYSVAELRVDYVRVIYTLCLYGNQIAMRIKKIGDEKLLI